MVESVGRRLSQARQKRGLTIYEAAHATRLRPDKITALESDDYSRFANNIYAKGFLQIYARYLNVDVADFARTLDNANPISVSDYQYLNNAPQPREEPQPAYRDERRPPSLAPLFVFLVLVGLGLAGSWFYANYQRIAGDAAHTARTTETTPAPKPTDDAAFITATPPPVVRTPAPIAGIPTPALTPLPAGAAAPVAKLPDQDFVSPSPVATAGAAAQQMPPSGVNEVLVATVKKTWVTIRRDDPKAPPIFEDYVYPNANPLKLKGARFFIEARDPALMQITKNGLPFPYQAPGVPVQ